MLASQTQTLKEHDPEVYEIIEKEKARQFRGLELIASENFTSRAVLECLGSAFTNKYCEGQVGQRYYGGAEHCDEVEQLAKDRCLKAFSLDPATWGVSVQPYSGSPASLAVLTGLLKPHDRFMGLDLGSGGHLTHGFYTPKRKVSATAMFWEPLPYKLNNETGLIDFDTLEQNALLFRPAMIVIGGSAYPREYDYARARDICDKVGALLWMDMAHTAGLIAGGCLKSPFEFCDIVTSTTHKSLRGPRAGIIFFRKTDRKTGAPVDFGTRIEQAVFPGLQGGPHMHQIAAIATQMKEVATPEFKTYAAQIIKNCQKLAEVLISNGHTITTGGTDNHLIVWDLRPKNLPGARMDLALEHASITANKNSVPGDKSALNPGGVRLGTAALTSRGFVESDMEKVAGFILRAFDLAMKVHKVNDKAQTDKDFVTAYTADPEQAKLKHDVESFAMSFKMPGFDVEAYKK
jgi:glycine hydroxymethyltransferase